MTEAQKIAEYLIRCTNGPANGCAGNTGLSAIHKRIFNNKKSMPKADMVKNLAKFYADEQNIIDIWKSLSQCERDFVTYIIQYEGKEYLPTTIEYAQKHHFTLEYVTRWGTKGNLLDDYRYSYYKFLHLINRHIPDTKTGLFFPNGKEVPEFVLSVLKTLVEPMKFVYDEYVPTGKAYIVSREGRIRDFAAVVQFAGKEQLKVKKDTFDITKAKLTKLCESIKLEEVCDKNGRFCMPKEAKRNNDFKVALPLFVLAVNAGLVEIDKEGNVSPGKKSAALLSMRNNELAKKIFDDYLQENRIYELHYITYVTAYDGNWWIKWHECREPIINLLKTCPIEKFIQFENFNKYVKIFRGDFFRRLLNSAVTVRGYNFGHDHYGGYDPDWDECEAQIIRLILSFLSAIGMIDVAYIENIPRIKYSDDDYCVGIEGFRITKLGAWILGMTDTYDEPTATEVRNEEGRLLVLPDYSVVISGLKCRIEHETYISKFLTRISDDENAAVYRLDFQSAIKAFQRGITPLAIKTYLKKASTAPLPENVARSLDDWQAKTGKVKIQTLTILETDDSILLEEIRHMKGMENIIVSGLRNAVVIDEGQQKKAKTLIEKNGWFVIS